jgi:hypothetical protein
VLIGATVESLFDAERVGQEVRPVFIHRAGTVITRPPIDFSKLD